VSTDCRHFCQKREGRTWTCLLCGDIHSFDERLDDPSPWEENGFGD